MGNEFWKRVYARAQEQFGTTNIPVNTFNKVWILPGQAQVFEHGASAYVIRATLKVMLDEDYLALQKHTLVRNGADAIGVNIVRAIILPEIEKEVNTGKNFATLRQIYQALILAKWYKETIQNGLLDGFYINKNKPAGIHLSDTTLKDQIYERYLKAYKKGVFNYIKESPASDGQLVPRKYFSGGFTDMGMIVSRTQNPAMISRTGNTVVLDIVLKPTAAMNTTSNVTRRKALQTLGTAAAALMLSGKAALAKELLPLNTPDDSHQNSFGFRGLFIRLYTDNFSLKQVIEGVDFHRNYTNLKLEGPLSINIPGLSYAAEFAGMKIISRGAMEHMIQTTQPSTRYLLSPTLKTLAYHEMAHIKRERSEDPVTRLISTLTVFANMLNLPAAEKNEAENLEELDVRLTSFAKASGQSCVNLV